MLLGVVMWASAKVRRCFISDERPDTLKSSRVELAPTCVWSGKMAPVAGSRDGRLLLSSSSTSPLGSSTPVTPRTLSRPSPAVPVKPGVLRARYSKESPLGLSMSTATMASESERPVTFRERPLEEPVQLEATISRQPEAGNTYLGIQCFLPSVVEQAMKSWRVDSDSHMSSHAWKRGSSMRRHL